MYSLSFRPIATLEGGLSGGRHRQAQAPVDGMRLPVRQHIALLLRTGGRAREA